MPDNLDPYFASRLEQAQAHRVVARIGIESLPQQQVESNKELRNPIQEGTIGEYGWSAKSVDNIIDAASKGYIKITQKGENNIAIEFLPIALLPKELGHVAEQASLDRNRKAGQVVFGSLKSNEFTYLQTTDFAVEGNMDDEHEGKRYVRLYIDSQKLQSVRNVYLDPESLAITDYEYGHAFCVYGGVPFNAINRIDVIQAQKIAYSFSDFEGEDSTVEDIEKEIDRQIARLRDFVEKL